MLWYIESGTNIKNNLADHHFDTMTSLCDLILAPQNNIPSQSSAFHHNNPHYSSSWSSIFCHGNSSCIGVICDSYSGNIIDDATGIHTDLDVFGRVNSPQWFKGEASVWGFGCVSTYMGESVLFMMSSHDQPHQQCVCECVSLYDIKK